MALILVRHGESEGNVSGIAQGWLDVPLSERGRAQAAATALRLASEPVAAVYSSDLQRARDTAERIAEPHALAVTALPALREYGFGEAQGLTWAEIAARWPSDRPGAGPGAGAIPGEEGVAVFRARVAGAFDALLEQHRDTVAVVAIHGGTIGQILAHVLDLPVGARPHTTVANCALTTIRAGRGAPTIATLNDGCHLAELTVAD